MQRVSIRTLVLMLELLIAVIALQYMVMVKPARAGAAWLARDSTPIVQTPSEETY
jgi:hypothetical protein